MPLSLLMTRMASHLSHMRAIEYFLQQVVLRCFFKVFLKMRAQKRPKLCCVLLDTF
jgi:hypothetical protein